MFVLITYDVNITSPKGAKRLRNVARACLDYGKRVQNSVFECILTEAQFVKLPRIQQASAKLLNISVKALFWC